MKSFLEKKLYQKRGQVTPFIIVGVLIVIIAGVLLFINRESISTRQVTNVQVEPIRNYLEECIKERVEWKLDDIRNKGGRGELDRSTTIDHQQYNILAVETQRNNLHSLILIQNIINDYIESYITDGGCSLDSFRNSFDIEEDLNNLESNVLIGNDIVSLNLKYPLNVERGDSTNKIEEINVVLDDNFGNVYNVVDEIVNLAASNAGIANILVECNNFGKGEVECLTWGIGTDTFVLAGNSEDLPATINDREELKNLFKFVIRT